MKYRKGPKGLYYKNNKLIRCIYNEAYSNILYIIVEEIRLLKYDIEEVVEHLYKGLKGIVWLLIFPILPIIRSINIRRTALRICKERNEKVDSFPKDYYKIIEDNDNEEY